MFRRGIVTQYTVQPYSTDTGGAVTCAAPTLGSEPVVLLHTQINPEFSPMGREPDRTPTEITEVPEGLTLIGDT